MIFPFLLIFEVSLSNLVEELDDRFLPVVRIGPVQWLKRFISIDERQIGIDALCEIGPVRIALCRSKDDMDQTEVARVNIDPAVSAGAGRLLLKTVGGEFNVGKGGPR